MTHVLADRSFPKSIKERVQKSNHKYFQGLDELQRRRRPGGITPEEFDSIRSSSRQSWASECDEQDPIKSSFHTTYSSFHHRKKQTQSAQCRATSRPISPTRKNNPHPARTFVTLQLRDAPGFEPHKMKPGQDPYKVGQMHEKGEINTKKQLYYSTPNYESTGQKIIRKAVSPSQLPATQAWLKEASQKERKVVMDMLKSCTGLTTTSQDMSHFASPKSTVSLHRWLKKAGLEEEEEFARLSESPDTNPYLDAEMNAKYVGSLDPNRYMLSQYENRRPVSKRYETEERVSRRVPFRTDFQLHPEWVP